MKALLFDVDTQEFSTVDVAGLQDYYKQLNCDCIDIVRRKVGGWSYECIVDDEGLLKEGFTLSALNPMDFNCALVGNILFFGGVDNEGELLPVTNEDIDRIKSNTAIVIAGDKLLKVVEISY